MSDTSSSSTLGPGGASSPIIQSTNSSQATPIPTRLRLQNDDQGESILIQIDLEQEWQWKVYRDELGMYAIYNQKEPPHYQANHVIAIKLTATYAELVEAINNLAIDNPRPGVRGFENSPNLHVIKLIKPTIELDADGWEIPGQDTRPIGPGLTRMIPQVKVSSSIELAKIGVLVNTPGGGKGFVDIEAEKEGHCEMMLKFIAKRGYSDMLIASYKDTGKILRF